MPSITTRQATPTVSPREQGNTDAYCGPGPRQGLLEPSSTNTSASSATQSWNKETVQKRVKSKWMLIGFGQSIEVKIDEEEEKNEKGNVNKAESPKAVDSWDSFYDPICNLGIGRKGGLIQYLRMVGQEAGLRQTTEKQKEAKTTTSVSGNNKTTNKKIVRVLFIFFKINKMERVN